MIQCFVKKHKSNVNVNGLNLRLLYACKTERTYSLLPRIMHVHDDRLEIMLICEGTGLYTIGESKYSVSAGDVLIYNAGIIHDEVSNPKSGVKSYCLGINNVSIAGLSPNCLISSQCCPVLKNSEHFALIQSIFSTIYNELYNENEGAEDTCHYLTQALLSLLLQIYKLNAPKKKINDQKLGERIKNYIDQNYCDEVTLASIAEALNISSDYLSHTFKETTGYSPIQYIMRRRIGEAQTLLITTKHSITLIATKVGYDNSSYFNRIFTKNVGMTPKKYRECYTKKQNSALFKTEP